MTVFLSEPAIRCALGNNVDSVRTNLFSASSPGLQTTDRYSPGRAIVLGTTSVTTPDQNIDLRYRSRNNALLWKAAEDLRPQLDDILTRTPPSRIAIVVGTSTSGMAESECAVEAHAESGVLPLTFHIGQHELGSPALFLAKMLDVTGPAFTISTACSSSAKALAAGARLLSAGLVDAVIAGGVDTLCRFTVAGFSALEAVSQGHCNPFSRNRDGINLGEGVALFAMTSKPSQVRLSGWGEASDGYHVSAPDPLGRGARLAIEAALVRAGGAAADRIGYVNLHGTGTRHNDDMESHVIHDLLPGVPASSTKPLTGHTLGAAGAIEAVICWLTLTDSAGRLPPHVYDGDWDPSLPAIDLVQGESRLGAPPQAALTTSFAFGGSNTALVMERS